MAKEVFGISVAKCKTLLRDDPCGMYVFFGPEELLKQFYLQKFLALIEKEGSADFNLAKLDLSRDHSVADLVAEAEILPFLGERRAVVAKGFSLSKLADADVKRLLALAENFPPYLILILYQEEEEFQADKATLKKKSVKALGEKLRFVHFALQEERVLLSWSEKILAADGLRAPEKALRTLFRLCRSRMILIRKELEKLAALALYQKRDTVTEEDVMLLTRDSTEFAVWSLTDAVLDGAVGAAEKILSGLKAQEIEPVIIAGNLSRMLTAVLASREGADADQCGKIAGIFPWQFERYQRAGRRISQENLEESLRLCLDLDQRLKGLRSDAFLVTELAVLQIAALCGEAR